MIHDAARLTAALLFWRRTLVDNVHLKLMVHDAALLFWRRTLVDNVHLKLMVHDAARLTAALLKPLV
jgi:hypothetical protein